MYSNEAQLSMIKKVHPSATPTSKLYDSDSELLLELEQKRQQLDEEISNFRAQKEKEFKDFESGLRTTKKQKSRVSVKQTVSGGLQKDSDKPPSRSSSSSALNLLIGHGSSKQSQSCKSPVNGVAEGAVKKKTSPTVSQPVVSLDKLNITGENAPHSRRPRTPPTPTLLSKTLTLTASSSSLEKSSSKTRQRSPPPTFSEAVPAKHIQENSFTGHFRPSYIQLLDSRPHPQYNAYPALETPPTDDEPATAPSSFKSTELTEILPLSSSSFPPHVTISPGGHTHASKRSYTAPSVSANRIPSALRTASTGSLGRKPKHVTFRLADSAIVEPSSSYEEGPSPQFEGEKSPGSGSRSPLRAGKSLLQRSLSSDEEDAEAGVEPGMGMGDVIQRLNEYTVAEAAKHGENLVLEVEDDMDGNLDKGENDEKEQDLPMEVLSTHNEPDSQIKNCVKPSTVSCHEHQGEPQQIEIDDDGYFSPKNKHMSTESAKHKGNSPLVPYCDENWAELSSSDKDRLLFKSRRHSDDSVDIHRGNNQTFDSPALDRQGFRGGFEHSVDGGSGVGFFELDEELASPEAGHARPFDFPDDVDEVDNVEEEGDNSIVHPGLGLSTDIDGQETLIGNERRSTGGTNSKFGVGSVPINITRPSVSVSSSWIGTFGH